MNFRLLLSPQTFIFKKNPSIPLKVNKCGTMRERNKDKRRRNLANNMGGKGGIGHGC